MKDPFFSLLLNQSDIKKICNDYFKFSYSIVASEVWWGRPNFKHSGYNLFDAGLAQLVEQLICNQWVGGSNPSSGTIFFETRVISSKEFI